MKVFLDITGINSQVQHDTELQTLTPPDTQGIYACLHLDTL